eukprot:29526-Amphidinium_carterae.1
MVQLMAQAMPDAAPQGPPAAAEGTAPATPASQAPAAKAPPPVPPSSTATAGGHHATSNKRCPTDPRSWSIGLQFDTCAGHFQGSKCQGADSRLIA